MVVRSTRRLVSWRAFRLMCGGALIGRAHDPAAGVMEGIQADVCVCGGGGACLVVCMTRRLVSWRAFRLMCVVGGALLVVRMTRRLVSWRAFRLMCRGGGLDWWCA